MIIRRILVIKLRSLGDTVLMTAPLFELSKAYPGAEIHVAVSRPWAQVLLNHPGCDRIWVYEHREERTARARNTARLAFRLRKFKYDIIVALHSSPSVAMLAYSLGAPIRSIHFHGHKDKNRFSTVEIQGKGQPKPIIERDMDAIRALGIQIPVGILPQIYLTDREQVQGKDLVESKQLPRPVLGLALGASRPTKMWPISRFAELAKLWVEKTGGSVAVVASPDEKPLIEEFAKALDPSLKNSWTSYTELSVRQLASVLNYFSVLVGNDSGPRHVAVAVNTPTVTFIGPEHPLEWHPYPNGMHPYLYVEKLPCRKDALPNLPQWCALHTCVEEKHQCMGQLTVKMAAKEMFRVMKKGY